MNFKPFWLAGVTALSMSLILATSEARAQSYNDNEGSIIFSFAGIATGSIDDLATHGDAGASRQTVNWGIGGLVEFNINDLFGLETGAFYIPKVYERRSDALNSAVVQEVWRLHVPITARFWLSDFFSVAAGPFMSFKFGEVRNTVEIGGFDASYSTQADETFEWGLDFAATVNVAIADKTGFFIEGRYSLDIDQEDNEKSDQISGLLGIKLDLGS